jgi:hypothetical protein
MKEAEQNTIKNSVMEEVKAWQRAEKFGSRSKSCNRHKQGRWVQKLPLLKEAAVVWAM